MKNSRYLLIESWMFLLLRLIWDLSVSSYSYFLLVNYTQYGQKVTFLIRNIVITQLMFKKRPLNSFINADPTLVMHSSPLSKSHPSPSEKTATQLFRLKSYCQRQKNDGLQLIFTYNVECSFLVGVVELLLKWTIRLPAKKNTKIYHYLVYIKPVWFRKSSSKEDNSGLDFMGMLKRWRDTRAIFWKCKIINGDQERRSGVGMWNDWQNSI